MTDYGDNTVSVTADPAVAPTQTSDVPGQLSDPGPAAPTLMGPSALDSVPPRPVTTMSPDGGTLTLNSYNAPSEPPTPAQPGMWKNILMGALTGLSGVQQHGRSSFANGVVGGAKAGMEAHQQQVENDQRQQQINTQQQESQSNIQFQNLRAAQSMAEEARKVQEFHNLDRMQQLDLAQKTAEHNVYMQDQGLEPDITSPDTSDAAHGLLKTASDMNGGTVPEVSVNHDPAKGTLSVFVPTAGDDPAKKNAQLAFINKGRAILGLPAISMDAIRKPADRAAAFHDAFEVTNPIATDVKPENATTMLNNAQQQRDRWAKLHPDDTATLKQLDSRVDFLKTSQDTFNKAKSATAATEEQGKMDVTNSPANQQATARGAQLKSTAEKTGELNAVAANDAKANKGDPSLTGQDYIDSLPPERGAIVKAIGEGRQILSPAMLRSKVGIEIDGQVNKAYPGYDSTRPQAYAAARQKFTSGKIADGINNLNTAATHLGLLYDASTTSATSPGLSFMSRHIVQPFSSTNTNATNFQQYKDKVLSEIEHAYNNKALTDSDHDAMKDVINGWTPNTARSQERSLAVMLDSKLSAYKSEWNTAKASAAVPDIPIINPEAAAALSRITGKPVGTISAQTSRTSQPISHTGAVPPGGQAILRGGQTVGYIMNGTRTDF